jgi:hypothetical protein
VGSLAWLVIPLFGLCAAALWARWAGRRRAPGDDGASLAGYERFRQAMQRPPARAKTPPTDGDEDSPEGPFAGSVP